MIHWATAGVPLVALAFLLRIWVHHGQQPGGVDTWYYLAYADALRRRFSFDVRLPQYLLQDERQSYPPVFPMFLALLPREPLRRWFWAVSPALDCVHLVFLYWLAYKITGHLSVAVLTGLIYATTPQLVAETRSLNGRALGALLHTLAVSFTIRTAMFDAPWPWLPLALFWGALVNLTSATASFAYGFVCFTLTVLSGDGDYLAIGLGGLVAALVLSRGHFLRVIRNYVYAVEYWVRHRGKLGAHPVRHSPLYGDPAAAGSVPVRPGFLGGSTLQQVLRLIGENPYILALPLAPRLIPPWGTRFFWWASCLAVLSIAATLIPPMRALGPGRSYLKAAVFPTAYVLGVGIGSWRGLRGPLGVVTLVCLAASFLAIVFFVLYSRNKRTEQTSAVPPGLDAVVRALAAQPGNGLLCLPSVYADYACYHGGKSVLWGSHCGNLRRLEALIPVISRPVPELLDEYGVSYVLLDEVFVRPEEIGLGGRVERLAASESFSLYRYAGTGPGGA